MSIHTPLQLALHAISAFRKAQSDARPIKMDETLCALFTEQHDAATRRLAYARSMDVIRRLQWAEETVSKHIHRRCPPPIFELLMLGATEVSYPPRPQQKTMNQVCNYAKTIHPKFGGFVYSVLKKISQETPDPDTLHCPQWIQDLLASYGTARTVILDSWMHPPGLFIRHHPWLITREDFEAALDAAHISREIHARGWYIKTPIAVHRLPGYTEGWFYVQDAHAAHVDDWLEEQTGHLWDACAAPGGKTLAALAYPNLKIDASDSSQARLKKLITNLERARRNEDVHVFCHDASQKHNTLYDAIMLDVPCSGSGVFSKHPERKWLITPEELSMLEATQACLLRETWRQLKPGGQMLYMTCSVFPSENEHQVKKFLQETPSARWHSTHQASEGIQLLPQAGTHGGFYMAWLEKTG